MSQPELIHHSGWPWPLDAVQNWFESLWDQINTWISNAVSGITGFVTTSLQAVSGWINGAVESLKTWISNSIATVQGWISNVAGWISSGVSAICTFVSTAITSIGTWISDSAGWLLSQISAGINNIVACLSNIGAWLNEQVSNVGGWITGIIWGWVDGALRWATDTFRWLRDEITAGFGWIVASVSDAFSETLHNLMGGIGAILGPLSDAVVDFISMLKGLTTAVDVGALSVEIQTLGAPLITALNKVFAAHSPREPDEAFNLAMEHLTVANAGYWGISLANIAVELVTAGQLDICTTQLLSTPTNRAAWELAAKIYSIGADKALLVPYEQFMNRAFTPMLPPVEDLIRFVVREVITPDRFSDVMPLYGYSREWARAYWEAHWILPSPDHLYDAFHRKVITAEELNKYIVLHDFKPEPRPGVTKSDQEIMRSIIKRLIPRVDLRYGWEMGRLSDDELVEWYELLGYEEDAPLMADIQKARAMTEEISKVRDEWIRDFVDGFILEDTLRANLEAIGIGATRINYYVAYAIKKRERELLKDLIDLYEDGFQKDLVTEEEFRDRLTEIIVVPEVADLRAEKAYTKKYRRPAPPKPVTETKAEREVRKYRVSYALQLYRRYAIEKPEFVTMLVEAGVDPTVAAARGDYEELKRPTPKPSAEEIARAKEIARVQTLAARTAVEEFRAYKIDRDELETRLIEANLTEALASATVQLEDIRRPPPPIPPEEIERRRVEAEVKRLTGLALVAQYSRYELEKEELIAALIAAGFDPAEAAARADLEEARRPVPKPPAVDLEARREARRIQKLAESEALTLFRAEVISNEELAERLRALEYSEDLIAAVVHFEEIKLALKKGV